MNIDRRPHYIQLKAMDLELAYLAALTLEGLKPVSRWESPLSLEQLSPLSELGLVYRQIPRKVASGDVILENIFSVTSSLLDVYERLFRNRPIDKSPATQKAEGYLFGFPPCCIDVYIQQPYAPNDTPEEDRNILFHWPCPGCGISPTLIPFYRDILAFIQAC